MRVSAAVLCALLMYASEAFCQEATGVPAPVRRVLVSVGNDGASASRAELLRLSKSLALALTEASSSIRVLEYGSDFPKDTEKRIRAAEDAPADCWLWVGVSGEESSPSLNVKAFDLLSQTTLIEQALPFNGDLRMMEDLNGEWEALVSLLLDKLMISGRQDNAGPREALLTITALAGTKISGLPAGKVEVGPEGSASVSLEAPASYAFRAEKAGFLPSTTRVFLDGDREVPVQQKASARWSADVTFSNAFFPGAAGRFYVIPGWLFAEVDLTAYLFGLQFNSDAMLFSFPLTSLGAQFGGYFNAEDALFRFYGAAGAFLRVMWDLGNAEMPVRIDPLSPLVIQLSLGTELALAGDFRFFVELTPMFYASRYPDLLQASFSSKPFLYFFLPGGAISAANLRFGVRWML